MKRKKILEIIEIPEGINAEISGDVLRIRKDSNELKRRLNYNVRIEGKKIITECENPTKKDKKKIKSDSAHIKNMISGLNKKYIYKLQICSVHFPMNLSVREGDVVIKNFLGEVKERKARILPDVEVKIEKDIITVESSNKEGAGQTAANIENATRVRKRDRRIFQDGVFITEKEKGARK